MAHVVVHHLEKSRSHRLLWLLAELGVEYELKTYQRHPKTMRAPKSLEAIHPLGKAPAVEVDGQVLVESGAVIEELVERFGPHLRPEPGTPAAWQYRYWLHYAEGSLMAPLLVQLIFSQLSKPPVPFFVRPIGKGIAKAVHAQFTGPELDKHFAFIEQHLTAHPWFAGAQFTGADIQLSYPIAAAASGRAPVGPKTLAWLARCEARPGWQTALEVGGPIML